MIYTVAEDMETRFKNSTGGEDADSHIKKEHNATTRSKETWENELKKEVERLQKAIELLQKPATS
ncbi:hypothetical protein I7I50_09667 [Histoplasma capsulatum G186AR]|nr:hypothetical protein I7I52_07197 [Histoplasma capsulatum]QSS74467.1 hypothetical protein I7I50_09667 [Histoplasma capsulatum G186AR]